MATKEEWKEFFQLTEGRSPTIAEYEAAIADGSIANSSVSADKSNTTSGLADKKKSKKWVLALVGILVVLGIGGGVFGYVSYKNSQIVNATTIKAYLQSHGYTETTNIVAGASVAANSNEIPEKQPKGKFNFAQNLGAIQQYEFDFSPDGKTFYTINDIKKGYSFYGKNRIIFEGSDFTKARELSSLSQIPSAK